MSTLDKRMPPNSQNFNVTSKTKTSPLKGTPSSTLNMILSVPYSTPVPITDKMRLLFWCKIRKSLFLLLSLKLLTPTLQKVLTSHGPPVSIMMVDWGFPSIIAKPLRLIRISDLTPYPLTMLSFLETLFCLNVDLFSDSTISTTPWACLSLLRGHSYKIPTKPNIFLKYCPRNPKMKLTGQKDQSFKGIWSF